MNESELVASIAENASLTKEDAESALSDFLSVVEGVLSKEEKVQLVGFGTLEVRQREAREERDPRDPEGIIKIPASRAPVLRAGEALKESMDR